MHGLAESQYMSWADILRVWRRYAPVILLGGLLGGSGAYLLASSIPRTYEAGAVVLFSRSEAKLGNAADAAPTDAQQRAARVRSQIEILRGAEIVGPVIDQLGLRDSPSFQRTPGWAKRLHDAAAPLITRLTGVAVPPLETADVPEDAGRVVREYLDRLVVKHDPDSYILRIGFRGPDPVETARIVNTHVAVYRAWLRDRQATEIESGSAWLAEAVQAARVRTLAAEAELRTFKEKNGLVNLDGRTSLDQEMAQMVSELAAAQASLVRSEVRAREIARMQETGQIAALAAMSNSRIFNELRDRYAVAEAEAAALRTKLDSRNPDLRSAEANRKQLRAAMDGEIRALLQSEVSQANIAQASVTRLTEALEALKRRVLSAEGGRARLSGLENEVATERSVYLSLLQQLRSLDKVSQLSRGEATLLSPALVPDKAASPRLGVFTAFGFCLAAGLVAGGAAWRQGGRDLIRHTADASASGGGVRCLAVMPEFKRRRNTVDIDRTQPKYAFFLQELRSICGRLFRNYARPGQASVSVLVTSPLPGDGKSTFCRELGRCAAQNGVPTLIITTDNAVRGRDGEAGPVTELERGLPLHAVTLTATGQAFWRRDAHKRIEELQRGYGMVIIDTPPLSAMAESALLAPLADATIVLARVDRTPRSLLTNVLQQIDMAGGTLAGVVVAFARLDDRRGLVPGDLGYYYAENIGYHRRIAMARPVEDRGAASGAHWED
jgi:polysaccharide biosynthesis transport protein